MEGLDPPASAARPPAPDPLALVQAFVNTLDLEGGVDALADGASVAAWFESHGVNLSDVSEKDRAAVIELREALRSALEVNAHLVAGSSGLDRLTRAARDIPLRVEGSPNGPRLRPAGVGVAAALGSVLAAAAAAVADGSWTRLKVCRNDRCRWAYWDGSRNRSGVWCTMAVCGNRAKGRSFRGRRAGA